MTARNLASVNHAWFRNETLRAVIDRAYRGVGQMKRLVLIIATIVGAWVAVAIGQTTNAAVMANTAVAVDLYHRLVGDPAIENVFYSPWSVVSVMSMITEGAQRNTLTQMMKALHFGESSILPVHEGISALN